MSTNANNFDFDTWKRLAESDPEAFERKRDALIQAEISQADPAAQMRLRGLQWQIDMTRQRYKHPVEASTKLFEMMWEQVYGENGFLDALTGPRTPLDEARERRDASVLPFPRARPGD